MQAAAVYLKNDETRLTASKQESLLRCFRNVLTCIGGGCRMESGTTHRISVR